MPEIDVPLIGKPDPHISPIGAQGIGEIGIIGVSAAIVNTVFNATGKRIRELPITLDKLLDQWQSRRNNNRRATKMTARMTGLKKHARGATAGGRRAT